VGKIIDSFIIGVLCYIGMLILHMPFPLLIAVIVGVTNVIPFFGPFFGAVPSALLILLVSPLQCFYFIIFILVLQQIDGNIIGPRILGDSIGISGFWVLVSITVAGNLFGFAGMLLGVPVFAVLYTVLAEWMSARLAKKKLPTETEIYCDIHQVSDLPAEEDENQLSFDTEQEPPAT
jgi:predicted PurR-regulated permease PerM